MIIVAEAETIITRRVRSERIMGFPFVVHHEIVDLSVTVAAGNDDSPQQSDCT